MMNRENTHCALFSGESVTFGNSMCIDQHIVMGQHNTLWSACGPACVDQQTFSFKIWRLRRGEGILKACSLVLQMYVAMTRIAPNLHDFADIGCGLHVVL